MWQGGTGWPQVQVQMLGVMVAFSLAASATSNAFALPSHEVLDRQRHQKLISLRGEPDPCVVDLTIVPMRKSDRIQAGSPKSHTRTTVNGRPAFGQYPIWSRPKHRLRISVEWNGKHYSVPRRLIDDVFNCWVAIDDPTSMIQSVSVYENDNGDLRIHIEPTFDGASYSRQGTDAVFDWCIQQNGTVSRAITEPPNRPTPPQKENPKRGLALDGGDLQVTYWGDPFPLSELGYKEGAREVLWPAQFPVPAGGGSTAGGGSDHWHVFPPHWEHHDCGSPAATLSLSGDVEKCW